MIAMQGQTRGVSGRSVRDVLAILGLCLVASVVVGAALMLRPPEPGTNVVVIFPPSDDRYRAMERAFSIGDPIVRATGIPNAVLMHMRSEDFRRRARAAGAWLILDARSMRGCRSLDTGDAAAWVRQEGKTKGTEQ